MPAPFARTLVMDSNAAAYCARSGAVDRIAINAFVRGVKSLGLWESMVCWPLRSSQNAGFGDTVYSLGGLGTFNGTRVNGPSWGTDGVTALGSSSQSIDVADNAALRRNSTVGLMVVLSTATTANFTGFSAVLGKSAGGGLENHNYQLQENDATRTVSMVTGDGVSAGTIVTLNVGSDTDKHCIIASAKTGDANKIKKDGGNIVSQSNALTQLNGASTAPLRFNRNSTFALGGEYSFGAMFASDLSDSQMNALYFLYRTTLGSGLGLL